jgi:phenylpropionate dioxygenase-like ring-hydroxylating dioxygenase large terminal subunit
MHYTYFNGSRGVPEGERKFPELPDLPPPMRLGTFFPVAYPNALMSFAIDLVSWHEVYPLSPTKTLLASSMMVPEATTQIDGFETVLARYQTTSQTVRSEDRDAAEWQQRGLRSPVHRRGCYAEPDQLVHDWDLWLLGEVLGDRKAVPQAADESRRGRVVSFAR